MKKITIIMMAVLLSTATITACAGNNTPETKKDNESCPVFIGKVGKRLHIALTIPMPSKERKRRYCQSSAECAMK